MKSFVQKLFFFSITFFYFFLLVPEVILSEESLFEQQLTMEKSIQEKTERLIEKIIGSKDLVVLVNVELEREKSKSKEKPAFPGAMSAQEEYLPGISYSYVPGESQSSEQGNIIVKKIKLLITIDTKIPDVIIARIKKETMGLLKLNTLRGDTLEVEKIAFAKKKTSLNETLNNYGPLIFWTVGLVVLTVFLFGPVRHFFKTIVKAMEIRIEADTRIKGFESAMMGGVANLPSLGTAAGGGEISGISARQAIAQTARQEGTGRAKKFAFIDDDNIKNLVFLLKNEEPEKIAIVTNYLIPAYASIIMNSISPALQSKVAYALTIPKVIDPQEVDTIEKDLKLKLDYMVGGEEYFLNLLDGVDRESQTNILKSLDTTNPALATKLRQSLFFFEDIIMLEKGAIQKLIRETQKTGLSLALALKNTKDEIKMKFMDALSEGARAMLAEQIDLLGDVSDKRIFEEQKSIANVVRALEKGGEIVINRNQKFQVIEESSKVFVPEEVNLTGRKVEG